MRNKNVQMSLSDIYSDVIEAMDEQRPRLIQLLDDHIDFDRLIPVRFMLAFYTGQGRGHIYHLESYIRAFVLQKLLGIPTDSLLLNILHLSGELKDFCGFRKIPDASQLTRFREKYAVYLQDMFEHMVDITEPICREINAKKADYLIYDTTGIELPVAENNPKYLNHILKATKKYARENPEVNPYGAAYKQMPSASKANPDARQQYINGHFCYAVKVGILTNGLGVPRHIAFFDDSFRKNHPEIQESKTDDPNADKELGDSTSLKPVLSDYFSAHPTIQHKTFLGDSAFDSYDIYSMLRNEFHFDRACIPLNQRNFKSSNAEFNAAGTPICPQDGTPFTYLGKSGGKNRSERYKWVCHKSVPQGSKRVCTCEHPCTASTYGKCVYTYPDKNFRLYPGISRETEHWDNLYRHRVLIERSFYLMKDTFALDSRKSLRTSTAKADVYLSGIVQLLGVLLADALHKPSLYKSLRKLLA